VQIVLPPSQTKRDGGAAGSVLDLASLGFPELTPARTAVIRAVTSLARDATAMARALRLGPTQGDAVERNRAIRRSPVLPALARYTGVLYEALGEETLSPAAREFAGGNVLIHSALFGLVRAGDPIPRYRLAHDSRLPALGLGKLWPQPISAALARHSGLTLDLRSEAYVALGPAPHGSFFLRLVSEGPDGRRRALNHFNKKGKGRFVRALLDAGIDHADVDSLLSWTAGTGLRLRRSGPAELELVV
jgi:uncharacterized protein